MGKFSFSIITERELKLPFYLVGAGVDFHQETAPHYYYPVSKPWKVHRFTFKGKGLPQILKVLGLKESGVYSVVRGDRLVGRMRVAFHHLRHLFKETLGHRPFEYVNTRRIALSRDVMNRGTRPLQGRRGGRSTG